MCKISTKLVQVVFKFPQFALIYGKEALSISLVGKLWKKWCGLFFQGNDVRWKSSSKRYPRLEVIQAPTASVWAKKIQPVLLGKRNWTPRMMVWKMIFLVSMGIWGVHVSFQGCMVFSKECLQTERENPRESYIPMPSSAKSNVKVLVCEAASGELVSLAILSKHCSKCDTWPTDHIDWKASVVVMQLWTRIMTPKPCLVI